MGRHEPNTTWRKHFEQAREWSKYQWREDEPSDTSAVVAVAPNEEALDVKFDDGYGGSEGPHILIWTEDFVYFPVVYDGAESLGRAPRMPRPEGQAHVGGE